MLGSVVFLKLGWTRESDRIRADLRARGYPLDLAGLDAGLQQVPEASNAALAILRATERIHYVPGWMSSQELGQGNLPRRGEPWPAPQRQGLAALVRSNAEYLRRLRSALQLPASRYPVHFYQYWGPRRPAEDSLLPAAQLLRAATLDAVLAGDGEEAVRRVEELSRLAGTLAAHPEFEGQMARLTILHTATESLEDALSQGRFSSTQLQRLESAFDPSVLRDALKPGLVGTLCLGATWFRDPDFSLGTGGCVVDDWTLIRDALTRAEKRIDSVLGIRAADEALFLAGMRDLLDAAALEWSARWVRLDELEARWARERSRRIRPPPLLRDSWLPASLSLFGATAEAEAMLAAARVACALELYRLDHAGELPDRLDRLLPQWLPSVPADPFDGQPLRYLRQGAGYTVYSVGEDRQDSGGRERPRGGQPGPVGSFDLTFTVERRGA